MRGQKFIRTEGLVGADSGAPVRGRGIFFENGLVGVYGGSVCLLASHVHSHGGGVVVDKSA